MSLLLLRNTPSTSGAASVMLSDVLAGTATAVRTGDLLTGILDTYTHEPTTFRKVTTWWDGPAMTDARVDNVLYLKIGTEYFRRSYTGATNFAWFGCSIYSNNNSPAFARLMASIPLETNLPIEIAFPAGRHNYKTGMAPGRRNVSFRGLGGVHAANMNAADVPGYGLYLSHGTGVIEDMVFLSDYGTPVIDPATNLVSEVHDHYNAYAGIRCSAVYSFRNVRSQQWRGHGWWFAGNVGVLSDASRCRLDNCAGESCRGAGFMIGGRDMAITNPDGTNPDMAFDANQILFIQPDYRDNRWGMVDSSFLGVQGLGNHGNNNLRGHLLVTNANNITEIYGNYDEDGSPSSQIAGKARVTGRFTGNGAILSDTAVTSTGSFVSSIATATLTTYAGGNGLCFVGLEGDTNPVLSLQNVSLTGKAHFGMKVLGGGEGPTFEFHQIGATLSSGPGASYARVAETGGFAVARAFHLGARLHLSPQDSLADHLSQFPTRNWLAGDTIYNPTPTAQGPHGWLCVQSGRATATDPTPVSFVLRGEGRGTIAQRPTPASLATPFVNAAGFRYFVTDGTPRWTTCTGAAWIDA